MKQTTLCYIENAGKYLMLLRNKKKNDENSGKWVGIGGKFEEGETPFDCVRREVLEETGLTLISPKYRGLITFVSDQYGTEYMHLFTADNYSGELKIDCDEGELDWVEQSDVTKLRLWEGDRIFLDLLLKEQRFFTVKLIYEGDVLVDHVIEI